MDVTEATQTFRSHLSPEPLVGIPEVAQNMSNLRSHYRNAGFGQFESFGLSYHAVTTTIEDQVNAQKILRMQHFRQPQVLDTAIGIFHHKYTEAFVQKLEGEEVRPHWNVLMNHELAPHADKGIQAALGYIAHIGGGDLALTVYETAESGRYDPKVMHDYIKHDYSKIDESLALTAQKLAPLLIEGRSPKARDTMVKLAMGGIVLGRKWARRDFRKLERARSEDERQSIVHAAEQRTAKFATFVLETSYAYQAIRAHLKEQPTEALNAAA